MTTVFLAALGVGVGLVGIVIGLRRQLPTLEAVLTGLSADGTGVPDGVGRESSRRGMLRIDRRAGELMARAILHRGAVRGELDTRLAICDLSLADLCAQCFLGAAVGGLLPLMIWAVVRMGGVHVPPVVPMWVVGPMGAGGALMPIALLGTETKRRRRLATRVVCSFLDLVVLSLAGGMGIESALMTAAELGETDISRRIFAALSLSRDSGEPPWTALAELGRTLGIGELGELAAAAGLAGEEGTRVRATLSARAASIRRHELAEAEAEANATTERLFLPGALLLVGFLLFVGYPAFSRITTGL